MKNFVGQLLTEELNKKHTEKHQYYHQICIALNFSVLKLCAASKLTGKDNIIALFLVASVCFLYLKYK